MMKTNMDDTTKRVEQNLVEKGTREARQLPAPTPAASGARRPRGLIRLFFRLPVWLYRLGLGWLLGERFLLLNHVGRKSGRRYQTVVEVARREADTGLYLVASGYGKRADWYRNLRHNSEITVQVGRRHLDARAELLSSEQSGQEMVDYARRHPAAARNLAKMIGYEIDKSEAGYRELGRKQIPFVTLHTRELAGPRQSRADRGGLSAFFLLAFLLSWLVEVPLALKAQGDWSVPLPYSAHYLAAFGPMLAALLVSGQRGGWGEVRSLLSRIGRWRVGGWWWLVAVSPIFLYGLVVVALGWVLGRPAPPASLGRLNFLPDLGLAALPFWVLTFGLGEETGWRGYALPRLQQRHSALAATLILWFFWALWHLPLFFYTYDAVAVASFLPGLLAGAIIFTWLYNSTGSILIAAVWHGAFNYTTACTACGAGIGAAAVSTLVMVGAVILLLLYEPLTLSAGRRQLA